MIPPIIIQHKICLKGTKKDNETFYDIPVYIQQNRNVEIMPFMAKQVRFEETNNPS